MGAVLLFIVRTLLPAGTANRALIFVFPGAFFTDITYMIAVHSVQAVIKGAVWSAFLFKNDMRTDFFGNRRAVFVNFGTNSFKA